MSHGAEFIHRFEAGDLARPVLLALHGTGGDENDLVPLAKTTDPRAAVLSPRGKVLEQGMPPFFRRLAEGVFEPAEPPAMRDLKVLICAGRDDPIVPRPSTARLSELLASAGAEVTLRSYATGHSLLPAEIREAAAWYRDRFAVVHP